MAKRKRKIVAAGWYVSAGLVFVLVAIPPEWLNTASARMLLARYELRSTPDSERRRQN